MTADTVIGFVHPGEVTTPFLDSLLRTIAHDRAGADRIAGWNGVQCSANISAGRNALVEWFLASPARWLVSIDTDMCWRPDAVHRLLEVADPVTAPIVGGLCFAEDAGTGQIWPTLFDLGGTEADPEFVRYDTYPPDTLFPVVGTGAAFVVMYRGALEAVRDRKFSATAPWYEEREMAGKRVGEDMTLCLRAAQCDIPVHVHTGVAIGHIKRHVVTETGYLTQRAMIAEAERRAARDEYLAEAYPEGVPTP